MPSLPRELPVLLTPRGRLRPFDGRDAADLFAIYGDPLVMRFVGEPPFPSLATVSQMLASVERLLAGGESLEWGLVLRGSGRLVGTCGLHSFAAGASLRQAEVGCMLARSHWGQGLMGGGAERPDRLCPPAWHHHPACGYRTEQSAQPAAI
ncbi:hypothetical protein KAM345_003740 [Aeromonas caviae]|nr:hypothetical protein KAM345_003740 [Aeromonas caviae]